MWFEFHPIFLETLTKMDFRSRRREDHIVHSCLFTRSIRFDSVCECVCYLDSLKVLTLRATAIYRLITKTVFVPCDRWKCKWELSSGSRYLWRFIMSGLISLRSLRENECGEEKKRPNGEMSVYSKYNQIEANMRTIWKRVQTQNRIAITTYHKFIRLTSC